jgi:predicted metal-dependent hydrolase
MPDPKDRYYSAFAAAITFIVPHIERYLIRMMSRAKHEIDDEQVVLDMQAFSSQEAEHTKGHERLNAVILSQMSDKGRAQLEEISQELAEDYRYFLNTKTLNFNLAYAEGFESMTCAMAMWSFQHATYESLGTGWRELIEWHLAEEIEHRTVAFDVYHAFRGNWLHRVVFGSYAQYHLVKYLLRFGQCFLDEYESSGSQPSVLRLRGFSLVARYAKTLLPWYSPHRLQIDARITEVLAKYA